MDMSKAHSVLPSETGRQVHGTREGLPGQFDRTLMFTSETKGNILSQENSGNGRICLSSPDPINKTNWITIDKNQ
jgi:hypothetical protein